MQAKLPFPVNEEKGSAKFDKKSCVLTITLPVDMNKLDVSKEIEAGIDWASIEKEKERLAQVEEIREDALEEMSKRKMAKFKAPQKNQKLPSSEENPQEEEEEEEEEEEDDGDEKEEDDGDKKGGREEEDQSQIQQEDEKKEEKSWEIPTRKEKNVQFKDDDDDVKKIVSREEEQGQERLPEERNQGHQQEQKQQQKKMQYPLAYISDIQFKNRYLFELD